MSRDWVSVVWGQYGAALEMLENAIQACPESLWGDRSQRPEFWYVAFHTLFFLDFYLADSEEGFAPPPPFGLEELDPAGRLPDRVYSKAELLTYLEHGRRRCRAKLDALTEDQAHRRCGFAARDLSEAELFLYTLRHVQHHAAQLNLILRQKVDAAPRWVSSARDPLART